MTQPEPDSGLNAAVNEAVEPAIAEWWQGVLAVERAFEPEPPEIIRLVQLNGLIDPEQE